jgi:hypothetical protein
MRDRYIERLEKKQAKVRVIQQATQLVMETRGVSEAHAYQLLRLSRIGVIEPGMIGITRPPEVVPKRDFEGFQECCFLPDLAMAFSLL